MVRRGDVFIMMSPFVCFFMHPTAFSLDIPMHVLAEAEMNEAEMMLFAQNFALCLQAGDCVLLIGEVGAGKSTMARAIIKTLTGETEVPSPTFTLVQAYQAANFHVWHYDLYRISHAEEMQ
ncbi:MAG: tRNA (adenosine(37)-N6)-threonylcarbamoyltransferase complex ATPase subunit type 1 TsaE, partial [Rickettsiales bacterium]|nr:tRNA (adenosine(37)-N6)-threonylcarbamoyltransferase complex ATPase subunit type 1 TsaE [Rickettsiales bacterium]